MVLQFNKPKTKARQGTPGDTAVVTPAGQSAVPNVEQGVVSNTIPGKVPPVTPPSEGIITEPQVEGPSMNTIYTEGETFTPTDMTPQAVSKSIAKGNLEEPPAQFTPSYNPTELAKVEGEPQESGLYKPVDYSAKEMAGALANGGFKEKTEDRPFTPSEYDPKQLAIQDAFDSVYGDKPGFVPTDEADGGFLDWARNVVDPEELRKKKKENKMRLGITALADAFRHFGNIYHTTKGAPSQTLTNATEKEYLKQQQEEQKALALLQQEYESEMKRLDLAYKRALERQKYEEAKELQKEKIQLQKDNFELRKEIAENNRIQQEFNRTLAGEKFEETKRHNKWSEGNQDARTYFYTHGGGRSGGGRGRGGQSARGGGKGGLTVDIPDEITRNDGSQVSFAGDGDKEDYINELYDVLHNEGLVKKGDFWYSFCHENSIRNITLLRRIPVAGRHARCNRSESQ